MNVREVCLEKVLFTKHKKLCYKLTESGRNSLLIVEVLYEERLFGATEMLG
jgi:hypothetical protein